MTLLIRIEEADKYYSDGRKVLSFSNGTITVCVCIEAPLSFYTIHASKRIGILCGTSLFPCKVPFSVHFPTSDNALESCRGPYQFGMVTI